MKNAFNKQIKHDSILPQKCSMGFFLFSKHIKGHLSYYEVKLYFGINAGKYDPTERAC